MLDSLNDNIWYEAAISLAVRAEDIADPTATYVNTVFLAALQNKRNQVIFGRRGTGKTHLLRRLQDELLDRFTDVRIVPIYIDGATLQGSVFPYSDPAAIALAVYVELLRRVVRQLSLFIDDQIRPGLLDRLFSGPKQGLLSQVREAASRLDQLLAQGKVRMLPMGDASTEFENLDEGVTKRRLAAGINAAASLSDPRTLGVRLDASAEKNLINTVKTVATRKIGGETYLPFAEITELISRLLAALGNASLAILVDEWSAAGDANVQPLLAQLLRLTARQGICVKLACIPGRTRLFQPGATGDGRSPIGFELGDDITADVDLDSIVFVDNDIKQLAEFFLSLLQRHMGVQIPELLKIDLAAFWHDVLGHRMEHERILAELCHASGAVPRDFINIFRQATLGQRAAGADKMTIAHVRAAALNIYAGKRSNLASTKPDLLDLLDRIYKRVVIGQRTYFFLVEESLVSNPRIVELFTAKLIHKTPATWLDPNSYTSYAYYMIDYGTSIEFLRKAGSEAWDKVIHQLPAYTKLVFISEELFGKTHGGILASKRDEMLDRLVGSFSASRLDAEPSSLIVAQEMIDFSKPMTKVSKPKRTGRLRRGD